MVDAGASSALRSWAIVDVNKWLAAGEEAERRGVWRLAVRCTNDVCLILFVRYGWSCLGLTWASSRCRARDAPAGVHTCERSPMPRAVLVFG